ncbi:MAG: hypothetical protein IKP96_05140 [Elusimicrobiaceae bacterium]|nr:hypothetical protein [Elusimicrobiaceae bacterium]
MEWQDVFVSYFPEKDYRATNPIQEARKDLKGEPFIQYSTGEKTPRRLYQCVNKNVAIVHSYDPAISKINASVYHPYAFSLLRMDSYLEFDLDPNSELVKEVVSNFLDYLCNHFNPKQFWETQKLAPFSFLRRRNTNRHALQNPTTDNPGNSKQNKKAATAKATSNQTNAPVINKKTNHPVAAAGNDAWHVLGAYFYRQAVSANLSSVRQFATSDKQQVLKINFSSGNKEPFLQKLQTQFANDTHSSFACKNQNIIFEVQTTIYQVFILSSNAISVLAKPAGYPANSEQRKELCNFNATLAW